ncbi:MAG: hypothetical protein MZV70_07990 [Desulfobacterales bacterium]|nr:hypothetical protein [Desulfobacterales bacterium]
MCMARAGKTCQRSWIEKLAASRGFSPGGQRGYRPGRPGMLAAWRFRLPRTVARHDRGGTRQRRRVARILEEPAARKNGSRLSSSCGGNVVELTPDFDEFFRVVDRPRRVHPQRAGGRAPQGPC